MNLLVSLLLLTDFSNADCVKDRGQWRAQPPYKAQLKKPMAQCKFSAFRVRFRSDQQEQVAYEWKLKDKKGPPTREKHYHNADTAILASTFKPHFHLIAKEIYLPPTAVTNNPDDHSNLTPLLNPNKVQSLKMNNIGLTKNFYAQQVISCTPKGQEIARLQLVALHVMPGYTRANENENIYKHGSSVHTILATNDSSPAILSSKSTGVNRPYRSILNCRQEKKSASENSIARKLEEIIPSTSLNCENRREKFKLIHSTKGLMAVIPRGFTHGDQGTHSCTVEQKEIYCSITKTKGGRVTNKILSITGADWKVETKVKQGASPFSKWPFLTTQAYIGDGKQSKDPSSKKGTIYKCQSDFLAKEFLEGPASEDSKTQGADN